MSDQVQRLVILILTSPENKFNLFNKEDFTVFEKIKTFDLEDLKGRNLDIKSLSDNDERNIELIIAVDTSTGEIFVLKQIIHPIIEPVK